MSIADALRDLLTAKSEHDENKAKNQYEWGYWGYPFREALELAEHRFLDALNEHIDERIKASKE
jgi:hypothetical protein